MSSSRPNSDNRTLTINVYDLFLVAVISAFLGTTYWLVTPDTGDRISRVAKEFDQLQLESKFLEAEALLLEQVEGRDSIDPLWIGLIRQVENGYLKLSLMIKVLRHDPLREPTYREISKLIEIAPEAFHREVKPTYLRDLAAIEGINPEFLRIYNLLPDQ